MHSLIAHTPPLPSILTWNISFPPFRFNFLIVFRFVASIFHVHLLSSPLLSHTRFERSKWRNASLYFYRFFSPSLFSTTYLSTCDSFACINHLSSNPLPPRSNLSPPNSTAIFFPYRYCIYPRFLSFHSSSIFTSIKFFTFVTEFLSYLS